MAILPIITAPDPLLKVKSKAVDRVDDGLRTLMDDMLETMYLAPGIGLSAIQVAVPKRVVVVDVAREDEPANPLYLVNPELVRVSDNLATYEEGCLSLPDHYADVERPAEIEVAFLDYHGKTQTLQAEGLLATCIQHEMDHLEGLLFVDHISALKRNMILRKLKKAKRLEATA